MFHAQQHSFPLLYKCQNYDWGKTGTNSLVYQLSHKAGLTSDQDSNKPFAELWMGDHPPAAASVKLEDGNSILLNELISQDPEKYLGKAYEQFGKKGLPFLMKVLSVNKTLSLQVHPDKELAKELHQKQPDVYKDDNHKPEISIALSEFECMCNFRDYNEIVDAFKEVTILREFLGEEVVEKFENCAEADRRERMREIIKVFLSKDGNAVKEYTTKLVSQISQKPEKSTRDKLVLKLQEQWPNDIGLLISYVLNYIVIPPGKALIMDPDEPHAYIHGNCIEVMAASDNVIRGCLTPKHIDRETLCRALSCKMNKPKIYDGEQLFSHEKDGYEVIKYPTPYEEFTCVKIEVKQKEKETTTFNYKYPSICIVVKGEGSVAVKSATDENFVIQKVKEGESLYFLPDRYTKFTSLSDEFVVFLSTSQSL